MINSISSNIQPTFGSASNAAANAGSKNCTNKLNDFMKLQKAGPMNRNLFILNAFTFLLGSRLITSRDKDERRETLIRDVPTIIIAVSGVPALEKLTAKLLEKKTGFAITEKSLNSKNKVISSSINYETIKDWYSVGKDSKIGLNAFGQRLSDMGGDVKKIFSNLSEDIKVKLKALPEKNEEFLKALGKDKTLSNEILESLKNSGNKIAKKAELLKTASKFTGFATTLAIIGIIIPKINMVITNLIGKNDKNSKNDKNRIK
ncbi:hypothetical protein IJG72_03830 [bacterium]|nr:hypothetical protein [bacterium]